MFRELPLNLDDETSSHCLFPCTKPPLSAHHLGWIHKPRGYIQSSLRQYPHRYDDKAVDTRVRKIQ
ncbi:hypothetical protein BDD12DRAFT_812233 [Trichophaea hybrida]|nr:hypothetical protein BDD12DRAFT_812233 [Trichophaea hybrida]